MKKTRIVMFSSLDMSEYLKENVRLALTKIVFSLRSKTIDIKEFQPWKYSDDKCVKCEKEIETMHHFATCEDYGVEKEHRWTDIDENNTVRQIEIAKVIEKRMKIRKFVIEKQEDGQASSNSGSSCSSSQ